MHELHADLTTSVNDREWEWDMSIWGIVTIGEFNWQRTTYVLCHFTSKH